MRKKIQTLLLGFIGSSLLLGAEAASLGTYRIYLDNDNNPVKFNVKSNSIFPEQCELSFTYRGYNPDGSVQNLTDEQIEQKLQPVMSRLRYSPKGFTLKPNSFQFVAFSFRRQINDEAKEHRAYVNILCNEVRTPDAKGVINLKPVIMHSVPLVLRTGNVGDLDVDIEFNDIKINPSSISVRVNHSGNRSIFGDILLTDGDGEVKKLLQRNAVIYPEMDFKDFVLRTDGVNVEGAWIEFRETSKFEGAKSFKVKL
jgi:hypothetical protein